MAIDRELDTLKKIDQLHDKFMVHINKIDSLSDSEEYFILCEIVSKLHFLAESAIKETLKEESK